MGPVARNRLSGGGLLVDGTCDELGRRATWVALEREAGPVSLTLSVRLAGCRRRRPWPSGCPRRSSTATSPARAVHDLLRAADAAWARAAPAGTFGLRQRWIATCGELARDWPVLDSAARWRLGELTVSWTCVAPRRGPA